MVRRRRFSFGCVLFRNRHADIRSPGLVDQTIDLRGRYIVPPFAEAHNHNVEPRPDIANVIRRYLTDGIFYVKVPANPACGRRLR